MNTLHGRFRESESDRAGFELSGQASVFETWVASASNSAVFDRANLNMARLAPEMAHVSVLTRNEDGFRFRLAGSALRSVFKCDARGRRLGEVEVCVGDEAWVDASNQALDDAVPLHGRSITEDGRIHFWLRLPMSSNGGRPDTVLCHDRFLPHGAEDDPEAAAKAIDHALRLDSAAAAA